MPTVSKLIEQEKRAADLARTIWERAAITPSQLEAAFVLVAADRVADEAYARLSEIRAGTLTGDIADAEDACDAAQDAYAIATDSFIRLCGNLEVQP
jgi:hypothetical protein